ncbi:hypothetical protein [Mycolicibacter minnesotensis]
MVLTMCRSIAEGGRRCTGGCVTAEQFLARQQKIRVYDRERKARVRARKTVEQEVSMSPIQESELSLAPIDRVQAVAKDGEPRFIKHKKFGWLVITPDTNVKVGDIEHVRKADGDIGEFHVRTVMERAVVDGNALAVVSNQRISCEWCGQFRRKDDKGFPVFGETTTMYRDKPCCAACREVARRGREVHPIVAKLGLKGQDTECVVAAALGENLTVAEIESAIDAAVAGEPRPRWMSAHLR